MKKHFSTGCILAAFMLLVLLLCGCAHAEPQQTPAPTPAATPEPIPEPTPEPTPEPAPEHSELYIPGLPVEDVIRYFSEVALDAEFVSGGDASLLQKWHIPISYIVHGSYTEEDLAIIGELAVWLNELEGFPGMERTEDPALANLSIYFCPQDDMPIILGDNFWGLDGGVSFWYDDMNRIYDATICYREDMTGPVRRSVILEEIYNGLGPVQDTNLRENSLIWSGYGEVQELTAVDELILKLLYHPSLRCGMNAAECEAAIRELYY